MQINIPFKSFDTGGFNLRGGTLTSALIVFRTPVENLEIASKAYVDSKRVTMDASGLTTGTLDKSLFPAFSGEVTSAQGSGLFYITPTGNPAGSYAKVTINEGGRVVLGSFITQQDVPSLDWSKIILGKPTNLTGYGIDDALNKIGGSPTGYITTSVAATTSLDAVTKLYVDSTNVIAQANVLSTGDVITRPVVADRVGFLRCNGSEVSKTTFPDLYAAIGDTYNTPAPSDPDNFRVPDYSSDEAPSSLYYIKY